MVTCANCGNNNPKSLFDEGDTVYCSECAHRTRVSDGKDDLVVCPVCLHLRDRKAFACMWCNSTWGYDKFDQRSFELANEFEQSDASMGKRYIKLRGKRKI